jgi:hypothetical protein
MDYTRVSLVSFGSTTPYFLNKQNGLQIQEIFCKPEL